MNYCIIRSGNKQYQVKVGGLVNVELLDAAAGPVEFADVLLHVDGEKVEIGTPNIEGFKVYGTVMGKVMADKVQVFKYKHKSRYRKLRGHRQKYTSVKIESFGTERVVKTVHIESPKATREMSPDAKQSGRPKVAPAKKPAVKKATPKKAVAAKKSAK